VLNPVGDVGSLVTGCGQSVRRSYTQFNAPYPLSRWLD